jgi:hypothetical protein
MYVIIVDSQMNPIEKNETCGIDKYFRDLKRLINSRTYDKIQYIDVVISDCLPIEVQLHYQDKELDDEFSRKGVKIPHHLYNFPMNIKITYDKIKFDGTFDPLKPHFVRKDCYKGGIEIYDCTIENIPETPRMRRGRRL